MGFADLLSGLYAGNIEGHDLKELKSYAARFMDAKHYDPHLLDILYLAFRHKIAHLASPYLVFDTATRKEFEGKKQRLVTWTVYHTKRAVPVELEDHPVKFLKKAASPNASSSAIACRPASG
jgi:hypothetical protein